MLTKIIMIFFLLAISLSVFTKEFVLKTGKINLDLPKNWQESKDLFGVQLMFLGPKKLENRPVFLLESALMEKIKLDTKALQKNQKSYQEGRLEWLSEIGGKLIEFYPSQIKKLQHGVIGIEVGYKFGLGSFIFYERSHYLECGQKIYNFKTLVRVEEEEEYERIFEMMIRSFDCSP